MKQTNRARIAPIAPNAEQHTKPQENKGNQTPKRKVSPQTTLQTTPQTIMGDSPGDLSKMESEIVLAIRSNPEITRTAIASNLGITLDGVKYHLNPGRVALRRDHSLRSFPKRQKIVVFLRFVLRWRHGCAILRHMIFGAKEV